MPRKPTKSKVRVVARLRPENSDYSAPCHDKQDMPARCVRAIDSKTLEVWNWRYGTSFQYQFDGFFGDQSSQDEIYRFSIGPVLPFILQGENASVFAYGPTGAGKTYTMLGTPEQPGVIPRCLNNIFKAIWVEMQKLSSWKFEISFSYLEIYQEKVNDLLDTKKQDLPIRQDIHGSIFIPGLTENHIKSFEEFQKVFQVASQNRATASTKLNPQSSRSHSILLIKVQRVQEVAPFRILTGKMYLIDLAGSEDNRRTGNKGVRLKESGAINGSLFELGQVVDALNTGQSRIPYRNSKLTRLLQDSLGGTAHTCIIANIAPEPQLYSDTLNTLKFASKSRTIINKPFTRETFDVRTAFKRPHESTADETEKKAKLAKREVPENYEKSMSIPTGLLSPLRAEQESLEKRMTALERRLIKTERSAVHIRTENVLQVKAETTHQSLKESSEPAQRKLMSKRCPFKEISNLHPHSQDDKKHLTLITPHKKLKTCSNPRLATTTEGVTLKDNFKVKIDPALQSSYDAELLAVLNSGEVRDLRKLHAIGEKRALLIVEWRGIHGPFSQVQHLANVEGFTSKMVATFLKKNLLSKMVFT